MTQVPLRYPLVPCGSRSFVMDFAPTLPKALMHNTQGGRLMLKQNRFSLRTLRRGLAGKVCADMRTVPTGLLMIPPRVPG